MKTVESRVPLIYVGLSSKFLMQLRTRGLLPNVLKARNLELVENKQEAIEQANQVAKKEGGSPLLVAVEFSDFNIEKYSMTTDAPETSDTQRIRTGVTVPWNFLKVIDVAASVLPVSIKYKGQTYRKA